MGPDILDTEEMLLNSNTSCRWKSLGIWRMEIPFYKSYLPYSTVVIITFKSNRVTRRKESWALIPLTSGAARGITSPPRPAFGHWSSGDPHIDCIVFLGDLQEPYVTQRGHM